MENLREQARQLRLKANELEAQYDIVFQEQMRKKYKDLVGKCFELLNEENGWRHYYRVDEIESFSNMSPEEYVSIKCTVVGLGPNYESSIQNDQYSYLHVIRDLGNSISSKTFDAKKRAAFERLLL